MIDGLINKTKFYDGYIHSGAHSIFLEIKKQIENDQINYICGWSLGSMIACYIAYDIFHNKNYKVNLTLFGCPPLGDLKFKKMYDKHLYNNTTVINNKNDILAFPIVGNYFYNIYIINNILDYYHVGNYVEPGLKYKYNIIYNNIFKYHLAYF